jgi:SUKH-4 immunity protein
MELITFAASAGISQEWAAPFRERGVPKALLGRYEAASALSVVETPRRGHLVCFGTVMGSCRVCLDPPTGEVLAILAGPPRDEWAEWSINSTLEQFIAAVGAVLNRYPFNRPQGKNESDESYLDRTRAELDRAADDLKVALNAIDPAAIEDPDGFWRTLIDDVQMGNFSSAGDA